MVPLESSRVWHGRRWLGCSVLTMVPHPPSTYRLTRNGLHIIRKVSSAYRKKISSCSVCNDRIVSICQSGVGVVDHLHIRTKNRCCEIYNLVVPVNVVESRRKYVERLKCNLVVNIAREPSVPRTPPKRHSLAVGELSFVHSVVHSCPVFDGDRNGRSRLNPYFTVLNEIL